MRTKGKGNGRGWGKGARMKGETGERKDVD